MSGFGAGGDKPAKRKVVRHHNIERRVQEDMRRYAQQQIKQQEQVNAVSIWHARSEQGQGAKIQSAQAKKEEAELEVANELLKQERRKRLKALLTAEAEQHLRELNAMGLTIEK
eukprot:NODE_10682_length_480_cov_34.662890_g10659_i0.p1 GENE.NODE_10682_length_480_cov_34.662890_g10659_i0~~NODE_10682_length_480_cov_34.662890_g10659_i0.p1  ORF type:complete len:114 (+),score=46.53 NODE_10682_length_480_cov_34.662890_g10659_i0:88-429(+)